jgi:alkanesulfonate monooxygenase SsuD/methylene tetrahydromethanopterin reductase-like flavin-dependent oxidoreductase (luciferase family)
MHVGYGAAFQHRETYPDALFVQREMDLCLEAEAFGFDSVWLPEHHFSNYSLMPDPLQGLTYIAGRTSTIKLGTGVIVLPWHDPVRIAEQIILLDHLSEGRVMVGLGRGLAQDEFDGLRVPKHESRARFDEYARLLLDALETGFIEGGEITRQPRRELRPRPSRSFDGRVFSASVSPESAPIAAGLGLSPLLVNIKPLEQQQEDLERYRAVWRETHAAEQPPPGPILSVIVFVDEEADRAYELAVRYGTASHQVAAEHYGITRPDFKTAKGYEYYRDNWVVPEQPVAQVPSTVIYGTPDRVLDQLSDFHRALGLQGMFVIFHGTPQPDGVANVRCFVEHCLPELRSWQVPVHEGSAAA